jgi:hypothetical protein
MIALATLDYRLKEIKEAGLTSICEPGFLGSTFVEK